MDFLKNEVSDVSLADSTCIRGQHAYRRYVPSCWFPFLASMAGKAAEAQNGHLKPVFDALICEVFLTNIFQIDLLILYNPFFMLHFSQWHLSLFSTLYMLFSIHLSRAENFVYFISPVSEFSRISEAIRGRNEGKGEGRKEVNPNTDPIGGICLHSIPSYGTLIRNQPSLKT